MRPSQVKAALIAKMQEAFPTSRWKYYGIDVVEGFERPCFFTNLQVLSTNPMNRNAINVRANFYINIMQESIDEYEVLEIMGELQRILDISVSVGDRRVLVHDIDLDYTGTDGNIPEIAIELEWTMKIEKTETHPVIESVEFIEETEE